MFPKEERSNRFYDVDCVRYSMSASRNPKIIAVAGGKGGAGKTVFACMLGACLAGFERRSVLVDLDFSGAMVHNYLNVPDTEENLNTFFAGRSTRLTEIIRRTSFENLDVITLQSDNFRTPCCKPWQKRRLFHELMQLKADYIILDLGAASSNVGLDAFMMADFGILLSTNDMFSIINTYSFIRSALLRSIKRHFYDTPLVVRMLDECGLLVDGKCIKPLHAVIDQFDFQTQEKFKSLNTLWARFQPKVVLNFADESDKLDDFFLLGPVAKDLLNVELDYWGHVRFDDSVRAAIRSKRPEQLLSVNGKASEDVVRLVVRNVISREFVEKKEKTFWFHIDVNIFSMFDELEPLNCTPNCLLWNNCLNRTEGGACSRMNLELLKRAGY